MTKNTGKIFAAIGIGVVAAAGVAAISYGVYKLVEKKKLCCPCLDEYDEYDFDDEFEGDEADAESTEDE